MATENTNPISATGAENNTVIVGQPEGATTQIIQAEAGQSFEFNFDSASVTSVERQGGDLIIKFESGSTVVIENYANIEGFSFEEGLTLANGELLAIGTLGETDQAYTQTEPEIVANQDGLESAEDVYTESLIEEIEEEVEAQAEADGIPEEQAQVVAENVAQDIAEQLAQTEPAAGANEIAQRLAQVEPAAGDAGAVGAAGRGYGFNSSFEATGVIGIAAVGPINPTALEYNIPEGNDPIFIEEVDELTPIDPNVTLNDQLVLEDGTIQLLIDAAPVTADGVLTFTISGIPSDWTVDANGGTYDAASGTWTFTTTAGTAFNGGPLLSPPADSDVDLPNLQVSVTETSAETGRSGSFIGTIDVIVDAVADTPEVDGLDDAGFEGDTLDMDIPTALTGEEVNVRDGVTTTNDGSESITNIIIEVVQPAPPAAQIDLSDFVITNANGVVTPVGNTITFTDKSQLVGLQITPASGNEDFFGSIDFKVTLNTQENPNDTEFNPSNDTASAEDIFTVTWLPVADPPTVEVTPTDQNPNGDIENGYVYEDGTVSMDVVGNLDADGSGNEVLTLTLTGVDLSKLEGGENGFVASGQSGQEWVRTDGGGQFATNATYQIVLPAGENYTGTFTFTPDGQSDLDLTGMEVVASAYEPASNTSASSAPDSFDVYVDAVADDLDLEVTDSRGNENTALEIQISNVFTGEQLIENNGGDINDGSESIVNIVLSSTADLQNDFIVTNDNNSVTFDGNGNIVFTDKSDLNGLKIIPVDANYSGTISIDVTLNTAETALNGVDFDNTNNTATDTETVKLTWDPVIIPPKVDVTEVGTGADNASVLEDHTAVLDVVANLDSTAGPEEYLTLTLTGIDLSKLEGGENGFVATDSTSGVSWTRTDGGGQYATNATYTLTLPAGENYSGTFSFDILAQSDLDLTGMNLSATATDPSVDPVISASADDSFNVIVDTVADPVDVHASGATGEEGDTLAINITNVLTGEEINAGGIGLDDGSEEFVNITITGKDPGLNLNDYTFSNGSKTFDVVNNQVVITDRADVAGLTITPKNAAFDGSIELNVTLNTRDVANDDEITPELDNNTASDTDTITMTWEDDDEPQLANPDPVTVDESDFFTGTPGQDSAGNSITVEFGDDTTGATVTGNDTFGNPLNVTSNGDAIDVTFDSATNTYTGTAGTGADIREVFTLQINAPVIDGNGQAKSDYKFTLLDTIDHPVDGDNSNGEHNDSVPFTFGFTATDSDGDFADGTITVNVLDDGPTAKSDVNNFTATQDAPDYNVVFVLDVSGSMDGSKLAALKASVANLLQDFHDYNGGSVKVHLVPFAAGAQAAGTFEVTNDADYNDALDFLNGLDAVGTTNYEAPLQSAITWLNGGTSNAPIAGAQNLTYFISDGEPNRYVNGSGNNVDGSASRVMDEINGSDGTNEIADLKDLSKVISIGIGVNSTTLGRLGQIDSSGSATDVKDVNDLDDVLQSTNPLKGSTSGNVITGVNGGSSAADILSADEDTTLTDIAFGSNSQSIAADGSVTINGAYGTLTINSDGSYTYTLTTTATSEDVLKEVFTYTITDGDGDTASANLTINITIPDDKPANLVSEIIEVDESDVTAASGDTDSGRLTADFGNDGPGTYEVTDASSVTFTGAKDNTLTSNGTAVTITVVGNSYVGTANGETIFTLELNENTGEYEFTLTGQLDHADATNPDDVIELTFGVQGKDSDNDAVDGTITVKVLDDGPVAHDDVNQYTGLSNTLDGNVISGIHSGDLNGEDDLSLDAANTVTKVAFGSTVVDVPTTGSATIVGDHGTLEISADGSYTYTADPNASTGGGTTILNPTQTDVAGNSATITVNDITITGYDVHGNQSDLRWHDSGTNAGAGIGVIGTGDNKVYPYGESLDIDFANAKDVTLSIADLNGHDNSGKGLNFVLTFAGGSSASGHEGFVSSQIVNGVYTFTISASDYAGKDITGVKISSTNASFMLNNVEVDYAGSDCVEDQFTYTLTDADGDSDTATLTIQCVESKLIVGQNVDDTSSSSTPHLVGGEEGAIIGGQGADILVGDAGGSEVTQQVKNYNVLFVLDESGSMGLSSDPNSQISKMIDAVENLLGNFNAYKDGQVKVHFSAFEQNATDQGTFNVSTQQGLNAAIAFLHDLGTKNGTTNYEAGLASGVSWLKNGALLDNAETISYFISDGEPNRYLNGNNVAAIENDQRYYNEVTGSDGSNEIGQLHTYSDSVIAVGIDVNKGNFEAKLDVIASNNGQLAGKEAIMITDASELDRVLQGTNPVTTLDSVGGDHITGGEQTDLIFGDVLNTDALAQTFNLGTEPGAGWQVFEQLESNHGWTREDTIQYIRDHAEDLAQESTNAQGGRSGGNDEIYGGAGDDIIFGQEGDDIISGGSGDDILYGGSGSDTFLFDSAADGHDTIKDFDVNEDVLDFSGLISGYSNVQDAIDHFVFDVNNNGSDTVVSVNTAGGSVDLVTLEGVAIDLADLASISTDGSTTV